MDKEIRLQKFMANQGVASRRKSEIIIEENRVSVNGKIVNTLGSKINPHVDEVRVDGKNIGGYVPNIYILLNKPKGYISTTDDPEGRKTVLDLVGNIKERIYPVGRLDYNTEGLLILTNDGDFTLQLTHPSKELKKTYQATINGILTIEQMAMFRKGIDIGDYVTAPADIMILSEDKDQSVVELIIHEGKYHQVRRMFEVLGFDVKRLVRTQIASISRKGIPRGKYRHLKKTEIKMLKDSCKSKKTKGGHHGKG